MTQFHGIAPVGASDTRAAGNGRPANADSQEFSQRLPGVTVICGSAARGRERHPTFRRLRIFHFRHRAIGLARARLAELVDATDLKANRKCVRMKKYLGSSNGYQQVALNFGLTHFRHICAV
jgi:hypothetical protein